MQVKYNQELNVIKVFNLYFTSLTFIYKKYHYERKKTI